MVKKFLPPNKKLGQHFLTSTKVINSIVSSCPQEAEAILEIGPGPGVLTHPLSQLNKPFYLIEKDKRFLDQLSAILPAEQIHLGDILKVDFPSHSFFKNYHHWWVVSNLPYNISVPICLNLFRFEKFQTLTLMMQKEVARKFLPREPNSTSSLYSLSHLFFEVEALIHVPPGAFYPPPQVDSEVLVFRRRSEPLLPLGDWSKIEGLLRIVFSSPRKQLGSILKKQFSSENLTHIINDLGIDLTRRAETLELHEIISLYRYSISLH